MAIRTQTAHAVPRFLTLYLACTPCTAPTSHAAWVTYTCRNELWGGLFSSQTSCDPGGRPGIRGNGGRVRLPKWLSSAAAFPSGLAQCTLSLSKGACGLGQAQPTV
jgi:hypothetical protein